MYVSKTNMISKPLTRTFMGGVYLDLKTKSFEESLFKTHPWNRYLKN